MSRVGFDVGGTFTDFTVWLDGNRGETHHFKVPSTPHDPSEAIEAGLAEILRTLQLEPGQLTFVGHGTTVATNMVIERRGVKTGLLTTRGFRDVLEVGRQLRPHLYDYTVVKPEPLVPRDLRLEIAERIDADGQVLLPLDEEQVRKAAGTLAQADVRAVAICFLHSYRNPAHERRAAEICRDVLGSDVYVTASSDVLPEFREYERLSTTVINGYVGPRMDLYLQRFLERLEGLGIDTPPQTIHSNGGLMSVASVRHFPVRTCLSGPAAGVVGAARTATAAGFPNIVTYDVGGTSTDVSLVQDGQPAFASSRLVADYPVKTPMIDIQVIGAGGGSIAWIDDAGALKVGPHSAGAAPGPVAYGRGGTEPTLTDANIVLGRLNPGGLLKGRMEVNIEAARQAIQERIADPLGLSVEQAAMGIIDIAVANMSRAIRSVSTEKGHNVKDFALFAYGGAGPLHACAVAVECGMPRVIVPVQPGTMCARGILLSDVSLDFVRSDVFEASEAEWRRAVAHFDAMREEGNAWLNRERASIDGRSFHYVIDARYKGQNYEVQVELADPWNTPFTEFLEAFAAAHRKEYGYDIPGRPIELVNFRMKAMDSANRLSVDPVERDRGEAPFHHRRVFLGGAWHEAKVYDRERLATGARITGPAIVEEMSSTTVLSPGQTAEVDRFANLIVEV